MSLMTPILTTPSVYCAKAELLASSAAVTIMLRVIFIFSSSVPDRRPFFPIMRLGFTAKQTCPPPPLAGGGLGRGLLQRLVRWRPPPYPSPASGGGIVHTPRYSC